MKVLRVDFYRPWLNPEILNLKGWKINGVEKGYFSSGKLDENDGVMPLMPTSMIVGTEVKLAGNLEKEDQDLVKASMMQNKTVAVGPFVLSSPLHSATLRNESDTTSIESTNIHVIGFISNLVPFAPQEQ